MTPGAWKTFNTEDQSFWCCTGTGVEEYSKLNDSIYWRDGEGVYVNLFLPSELDWTERGFKLRQDTRFPEQETTALTVSAAGPAPLALRLRIPAWTHGASVKVNGRAIEVTPTLGSYLTLTRAWKAGDRVEMRLPMRLTVEAMPDDPKMQAFLYGPLVLAGDFGTDGLTENNQTGPNAPRPQRTPIEIPAFESRGDPASWIKPAEGPLLFRTTGQSRDVTLMPINSLFGRRYSIYWTVS